MNDSIREDVDAEVAALVTLVLKTFDTNAYRTLADGAAFDAHSTQLDAALARVRQLFNDYLIQTWSAEIGHVVDAARARKGDRR